MKIIAFAGALLASVMFMDVAHAYQCRGSDAEARAALARIYRQPSANFAGATWQLFKETYSPATGVIQINPAQGLNNICETKVSGGKVDTFCFPWTPGTAPYVYITNTAVGSQNAFIGFGPIGSGAASIGLSCK